MLGYRGLLRGSVSAFATVLTTLFMLAGAATADVVVSVNLQGNTVNYQALGLAPNESYTVNVEHDATGNSTSSGHVTDGGGFLQGSSTAGGVSLQPGDTVTVTVYDSLGHPVGGVTVSVPQPPPTTWLGKLWRWLKHVF